jgi:hypothetical protein
MSVDSVDSYVFVHSLHSTKNDLLGWILAAYMLGGCGGGGNKIVKDCVNIATREALLKRKAQYGWPPSNN